jgi:NAD(P)H-hydrate repair Nnr-like enzyme with NAD(P)H-hydrate epimerase domain
MDSLGAIPAISGDAMAEVDRIMMQDLGVDTLQLMELAGYGVADAIRRHAGLDLGTQPRLLALVGTGVTAAMPWSRHACSPPGERTRWWC